MRHVIPVAACLFALTAAALPAHAEDDLPTTTTFFETYDRNQDGTVTEEEFGGSREIFRLLDRDADGAIQAKELGLPADYRPKKTRRATPDDKPARGGRGDRDGRRLKKAMDRMDANKDGKLSRAEWKADDALFDRLDRNGDGVIDRRDLGRSPMDGGMGDGMGDGMDGPERDSASPPPGGVGGERPNKGPRGANGGRKRMAGRVKAMDANGDGTVSRDEWTGRGKVFDHLDRNSDGVIDEKELAPPPQDRADGAPPRRRRGVDAKMIGRFDRDKDGAVSRDEFPGSDARFDEMDRNGDGSLTPDDVGPPPGRDEADAKRGLIQHLDRDGDGRLSRNEFVGSDEDWKRLDADGNGWITAAEAAKASSKDKK